MSDPNIVTIASVISPWSDLLLESETTSRQKITNARNTAEKTHKRGEEEESHTIVVPLIHSMPYCSEFIAWWKSYMATENENLRSAMSRKDNKQWAEKRRETEDIKVLGEDNYRLIGIRANLAKF